MILIATPSEAWSKKKDVETVRKDIAGYGFDTQIVEVLEERENEKPKVTGYQVHVTIPSGLTGEDRREKMIRTLLEKRYRWNVESKRG